MSKEQADTFQTDAELRTACTVLSLLAALVVVAKELGSE